MDDVLAFRNHMAEKGYEYTPEQADKALNAMQQFRQNIHDRARTEPETYEHLANLTPDEKEDFCEGLNISMEELDQYLDLILKIYEEEKLF